MPEENEPEAQRVLLEIQTYGRPTLLEADRSGAGLAVVGCSGGLAPLAVAEETF